MTPSFLKLNIIEIPHKSIFCALICLRGGNTLQHCISFLTKKQGFAKKIKPAGNGFYGKKI